MNKYFAQYIGVTTPMYSKNEYYSIKINNNSNIVCKENGLDVIPYRSIDHFLKNWSNITKQE